MFQPLDALPLLRDKGQWQSIRHIRHHTHALSFRDAKPQKIHTTFTEGAMVEVFDSGQYAYAATSDLTADGIKRAAEKAFRLTQLQTASPRELSPDRIRGPQQGRYHSQKQTAFEPEHLSYLTELLIQACKDLKLSEKITDTLAGVTIDEVESHLVSSTGADIQQSFSGFANQLRATAKNANSTQSRTDKGMYARCYQGGIESLFPESLKERCSLIGEQALELLQAEDCPSETLPLILMPDQMMLQIHESIGHPLELDRILGDERNYAGWSFVRPEDFGSLKYGSPLMNVSFDPSDPIQYASYGYDDNGAPAGKEYLIKDGLLIRGLGGLESQARIGLDGVANSRAQSWNRAPIDRMANINLEAGNSSFQQIIESTERGILMESNRSWSIDDYRNKFQFGCEYAKLIEDGQITKTLRNPNYRGSTVEFWKSLDLVGDSHSSESFGTPFCGKGEPNQAIRVSHASPVCRFNNIEVFGGA